MRQRSLVVLGVGVALLSSGAFAGPLPPRVLIFNEEGYAASEIPGNPGVLFSSFLDGFTVSQNGSRWVIRTSASGQPSTRDSFYVSGNASGVTHVFAEGDILPGLGLGVLSTTNERRLWVNDRGDIAFSGTFGPSATNADEVVARYNAATNDYTLIAREGELIPGLNGERYGSINEAVGIADNGLVYYRDGNTSGSIPSDFDEFIFRGDGSFADIVLQTNTVTPTNQLGGTTALFDDFAVQAFQASEQGDYIIRGNLDVPSNSSVVIVNDRVEIQQGSAIPGVSGIPVNPVVSPSNIGMGAGGDWFAWGATTTPGEAYLLVNGELALTTDTALPNGLGTYDQIIDVGINGNGDVIVASRTDSGTYYVSVDPAGDAAAFIAFEQGIGLDLDGDGLANDDAFLRVINDISIADDGTVYVLGRAISGSNLTIGDGLFVLNVTIPSPSVAATLALGGLVLTRRRR
jgi:hypothetical protein